MTAEERKYGVTLLERAAASVRSLKSGGSQ